MMLECRSGGVMRKWSIGVMECWNRETTECWKDGIKELWNTGIMECWVKKSTLNLSVHFTHYSNTPVLRYSIL
jgi:hypothetical protein